MEKAEGGVVWVAKEFKAGQKFRFDLLSHNVTPLLSFDDVRTEPSDLGRTGRKIPAFRPALVSATQAGGLRVTAPMLSLPPMHTARFLVYEIPISRPTVPSRFFMASTPTFSVIRARAADRLHDTIGGIIGRPVRAARKSCVGTDCWLMISERETSTLLLSSAGLRRVVTLLQISI